MEDTRNKEKQGEKLTFNGIDGETGEYLIPPMTSADFRRLIYRDWRPEPPPPPTPPEEPKKKDPFRKPVDQLEFPWDLSETGWGVIFAPGIDRRVRLALEELLEHRRRQATPRNSEYYRDDLDYKTGQSVLTFLKKNGAGAGIADAERLPYYLLLVGDPESIPYQFQSELDLHYGVGRIYFENVADYRRYAESVVAAESGRVRLPRRLTFFGPHHAGDDATRDTADELIRQLAKKIFDLKTNWEVRTILEKDAVRSQLVRLLGGDETPGLLFVACHGVGFPWRDERQLKRQGALVCQDWPGPNNETGIKQSHYFAAENLPDEASLLGLVAFFYACHSLGTPARDTVPKDALGKSETIADKNFVSQLPQRLLAHPKGGALAVIGHVDRALTTSFLGSPKGEALDPYCNLLGSLLRGHTVSWAMNYLNQVYAAHASRFAGASESQLRREEVDEDEFLDVWQRKNDFQNFAVFGDPAVRLLGRRE